VLSAATGSDVTLEVAVLSAPAPEMDWFHGSERPLQGWSSPAFGQLEPAPVLRLAATMPLPGAMHLLFRPRAGAGAVEPAASALVRPLTAGHLLAVQGMPGQDLVATGGGQGMVEGGPLSGEVRLDGRLALARWSDSAGMTACVGRGLRRFAARGAVVAESESGAADFCFRRLGDQAVVEGHGRHLRLLAPGIRDVRLNGRPLTVPETADWLELDLGGDSA
jgi:hypothetical protein